MSETAVNPETETTNQTADHDEAAPAAPQLPTLPTLPGVPATQMAPPPPQPPPPAPDSRAEAPSLGSAPIIPVAPAAPATMNAPALPVVSPVLADRTAPMKPVGDDRFAAQNPPFDPSVLPSLPESAPATPAMVEQATADPEETANDGTSTSDHPMAHLMPGKSKPSEAARRAAEQRALKKAKARKIKIGVAIGALVVGVLAGPPFVSWFTNVLNEAGSTSTVEGE